MKTKFILMGSAMLVLLSQLMFAQSVNPITNAGGGWYYLIAFITSILFLIIGLVKFPLASIPHLLLMLGAIVFMYLATSFYTLPYQTVTQTQYPAYNVIVGNTITQYPAYNTTQIQNPLPSKAFVLLSQYFTYIYMIVCGAIALLGLLMKKFGSDVET